MKVSAVLSQAGSSGTWLAQCEEVERTGEGATPDAAVASLREALRDYFAVQAVAPPAEAERGSIEIVVLDPPAGLTAGTIRGAATVTR